MVSKNNKVCERQKLFQNTTLLFYYRTIEKLIKNSVSKAVCSNIYSCKSSSDKQYKLCIPWGLFTNYVTHFFDHPPTHGNILAMILLKTHHTRVCYHNAFAGHPPTPIAFCNLWTAPYSTYTAQIYNGNTTLLRQKCHTMNVTSTDIHTFKGETRALRYS